MSGSSVSLDYTQDGDVLFQLSAPVSGCHASLGAFPHWCLGNVSACDTSGFSLGFWFKLQTSDVTSNDVILLTNGGTTPNSDGFYILRRYGDQIEIGVAKGGNLWRETLRLRTDDVWSHMPVCCNRSARFAFVMCMVVGGRGLRVYTCVCLCVLSQVA